MKRAIVTGSNGFIGKNLIEEIKNDFEIDIPYWRDSLAKCILKLNEN